MMEELIGFIFGAVFGSFLNVLIYRIPRDESVVFPASHCPACGKKLKFYHNIPLLSWLFLGGKCAFCKEKISMQYPLIELVSGLVVMSVVHKYSLTLPALFTSLSFLMLLALSMIDFKYKMVPDSLNLLAIFFAVLSGSTAVEIFENLQNAFLFAGGFTLLRFALSYYLTSGVYRAGLKTKTSWNRHYDRTPMIEAMGEGDIMVAATMGALLGIKLGLLAIFLSAVLAMPVMMMVRNRPPEEQRVPFVPFLAMATFIAFMFGNQLLELAGL